MCIFSLQAVHTLISLHRRYVVNINRLNPADESAIWQVILNQREEVTISRIFRNVLINHVHLDTVIHPIHRYLARAK